MSSVKIQDLAGMGMRLGIVCKYCHRFRYLNAARFPLDRCVPSLAEDMVCARCGSEDVETLPIARSSESGYWPAEHS